MKRNSLLTLLLGLAVIAMAAPAGAQDLANDLTESATVQVGPYVPIQPQPTYVRA